MSNNIWFISDTHFNHDRDFIYVTRGFESVNEMNQILVEKWNSIIKPDDTVYHLGDLFLGDLEKGLKIVKSLHGHIHLTIGNHDTEMRLSALKNIIDEIQFGYRMKFRKGCLLLSHYPQITNNSDHFFTYSIHGHTHNPNIFCEFPLMYNVSCEAHNCNPIAYEDILFDIKEKAKNN